MVKVVPFKRLSNRTRGYALGDLVDDGELLEFSQPEAMQTWSHNRAQIQPKSIYTSDWTNQELADLYRAHSLVQSAQPGLECDRGISDEGDPWFIIGDDKGDVLIHICRIKGSYMLDSVALPKVLVGTNFNALIEDFLTTVVGKQTQNAERSTDPTNVVRLARGGTVCLHPSMMIAALVWTLLMNSKELTLPTSNDSSLKELSQDMGESQSDTLADDNIFPNVPVPPTVEDDLVSSERLETDSGDISVSLNGRETNAQRDEKQQHASAYSQALTAIAIAAGFYASAEATDGFWKPSTKASADISLSSDGAKVSEVSTPLDHLSDALALLSSVVDLVVLEVEKSYTVENNIVDVSADALTTEGLADADQQERTTTSEAPVVFEKASQIIVADASGEIISGANIQQYDRAGILYDKDHERNVKEQVSDVSLQGFTQAYLTSGADIIRFDASSFKSGLGSFNGELHKYAEAFDLIVFPEKEGGDELAYEAEDTFLGSVYLDAFDDAARNFIESKIRSNDMEILVFNEEVILIDKAAYSGSSVTVSWQLEDGNYLSMIGLSSDLADFLVA